MLRHLAPVAALSLLALACSSEADDAAPACTIPGTYKIVTSEQQGGTCGGGGEASYTIRREGAGYWVEIPGFQGGCPLEETEECKAQGKCDVTITDALDPQNNLAAVQFVWTFTTDGFTGSNILTAPPATPVPDGCRSTYDVTATRL
jgi:hypothetical protein